MGTYNSISIALVADADRKMDDLCLLKRMSLDSRIIAATSLLNLIYVITEDSDTVSIYFCCPPYKLKGTVPIPEMNPTDVATSYADVCVYLLDKNMCIWRIHRNLKKTNYPLDVSPGDVLKSMSITKKGVIVVVQNENKMMMFNPVTKETKHVSLEGVFEDGVSILHATEIGENRLLACHNTQTFLCEYDFERSKVCHSMNHGGQHITLKNSGCAIIADKIGHRVWTLDVEKWQIKGKRHEINNPTHVHYAMDNGLLFVVRSSMDPCITTATNYLDVYSFDELDRQGHLADPESETRRQQQSEAAMSKSDVRQSETCKKLADSNIDDVRMLFESLST